MLELVFSPKPYYYYAQSSQLPGQVYNNAALSHTCTLNHLFHFQLPTPTMPEAWPAPRHVAVRHVKKGPKLNIEIPCHVPAPRHVVFVDRVEVPRRRRVQASPVHLPLTPGFRGPISPAPRQHPVRHIHRHHEPRAKPARPEPPKCALGCGKSPIPGSKYCQEDTCKDSDCNHASRARGGYCKRHGCCCRGCRHRRAVSKVAVMETGGIRDRVAVSRFCGEHSCRSWGCHNIGGAEDLDWLCREHFSKIYH